MYDFIDRPLVRLAPGSRFILYAARGWIHAAASGTCPPGALAPAFARHGALPALPPFHTLLVEINRRARQRLAFAPIGHGRVIEDEAILLQLCRDATDAPAKARTTLGLLLKDAELGHSLEALINLGARLDEVGLGEIGLLADELPGRA